MGKIRPDTIIKNLTGLFTALQLLIVCDTAGAQPAEQTVAVATQKGIFVYLGSYIPKDSYYELEVRSGKNAYAKLATVQAPEDREEMSAALRNARLSFEGLDPLTPVEEEKLWDYMNSSSAMGGIYTANLPLMHLAVGTGYLDKNARPGREYQYRVRRYGPDGKVVHQGETNRVSLSPVPDLLKPVFAGKKESVHQVLLQWYVPEQRQLSSYNVFRRVFHQGEFEKVSVTKGFNMREDSVYFIVIDTTIRHPAFYEYYLVPLDAYGNPGTPSDPVGAGSIGEKYVPVLQRFDAAAGPSDHQIVLTWKFEQKKYLRSVDVYRSMQYDSGFEKVVTLPPSDTTYTDVVAHGSEDYYYYLQINGPFEKSYPGTVISVLYRDTRKPDPPVEVAAETVPDGIKIHWIYEEPFVKGFHVHRSSLPDGEFTVVSGLIPRDGRLFSFVDTSEALVGGTPYYYVVEAVSDSDVSSAFSPVADGLAGIEAVVPSPVDVVTTWEGEAVVVAWDLRPDDEIRGYGLFRKEVGQEFEIIDESDGSVLRNYFRDTTGEAGKTYEYAVQAYGLFGGKSRLSAVSVIQVPAVRPVPPAGLRLSRTGDGVHVTWGSISDRRVSRLVLYRQEVGSGSPSRLVELEKDQLDFLDKTAEKGKLYSYYMTSMTEKGVEGDPGQLATFRF